MDRIIFRYHGWIDIRYISTIERSPFYFSWHCHNSHLLAAGYYFIYIVLHQEILREKWKTTRKLVFLIIFKKNRKGLSRIWHASKYSWSGIKDAWLEPAFRLAVILFVISLPLAQLIGGSMMEKLLLISCIWFLMIVEVINSAIESAIDRVGLQYHELSGKAKDLGSSSVLMTIIFCLIIWSSLIFKNII